MFPRVGVLDPFPREVRRSEELVIRGSTRGGYKKAELIIIAPRGRTFLNKDNVVNEYDFTFTVRFEDGLGRYRMEIIAHSPTSTRSIARFSVWYGKRKPKRDPEPPPPEGAPTPFEVHPRLLEKRWLKTLNDFRTGLRLKPVKWNEAVAARAREHARRMAKARRHIHSFPPYGGLVDLLRRNGAGKAKMSGPSLPWPRVTTRRPFGPPAPQPRGPRVYNHVVPFVLADDPKLFKIKVSLQKLFLAMFQREAAFRICATDPNCVEVGVGIARPPLPARYDPKRPSMLRWDALYYSIGFVQINDLTIIRGQDKAYADLLRVASDRDSTVLRALGRWGRKKGRGLLQNACKDKRPEVSSAAFDGLLLLDEAKALDRFEKAVKRAPAALERGRYADAYAAWAPYRFVAYDGRIKERARQVTALATAAARKELKELVQLDGEERARKLKDLLARVRRMPVEAEVRKAPDA